MRTLWKEPPAMQKAQRPVQSVRMKMGPKVASYHGFRKVWGHREGESHLPDPSKQPELGKECPPLWKLSLNPC